MPRTGHRKPTANLLKQISSICRGCLSTGRQMSETPRLITVFEKLTGLKLSPTDGLPQKMCYECLALLNKFNRFRDKLLISQDMLTKFLLNSEPFVHVKLASPHLSQSSVQCYEYLDTENTREDDQRFLPDGMGETVVIKQEIIEVNEEPLSYGVHAREPYRAPSPPVTYRSDLPIRRPLKCYTKKKPTIKLKTEPQPEQTEVASVDSQSTEAEHHSLRARLRFDDDICINVPEAPLPATHSSNSDDTTAIDLPDVDHVSVKCEEATKIELNTDVYLHEEIILKDEVPDVVIDTAYESDRDEAINSEVVAFTLNCEPVNSNIDNASVSMLQNIGEDNVNSPHSNAPSYICDMCNKSFNDKVILTIHIREHLAEKPYKCKICDRGFLHKSSLNKHLSMTHDAIKPYQCDVCEKKYRVKSHLIKHYTKHTNDRPYKCDICEKAFRYRTSYRTHLRIHAGDKPFKCEVCAKCFIEKSHLNQHYRTHTGDKPYKCNVCKQSFSSKNYLKQHSFRHTGLKPFKCDICSKCFVDKASLKRHTFTHTERKSFQCHICKKLLSDRDYLKKHLRMHSGNNNNHCKICKRCFIDRRCLSKHIMLMHTGTRGYQCEVCIRCMETKGMLQRHYRSHLKEDLLKYGIAVVGFNKKGEEIYDHADSNDEGGTKFITVDLQTV